MVWAAVGPLIGVRYGQELARRNQKTQWAADSKKKEFKELLSVLDIAVAAYVKHVHIENKSPDDFWALNEAGNDALRCVSADFSYCQKWKNLRYGSGGMMQRMSY
ncbi:MAG: hypothetical protein ACJ71W_10820 [Terriglobales bacterium]